MTNCRQPQVATDIMLVKELLVESHAASATLAVCGRVLGWEHCSIIDQTTRASAFRHKSDSRDSRITLRYSCMSPRAIFNGVKVVLD